MKKLLVGLGAGLLLVPFISVASAPVVTCSVTATPSVIQNGVPTNVTVNYTTQNATTAMIGSFATQAAVPSMTQTYTISGAKRFEMVAFDYATGNAHYCFASVSSVSHGQPN